MKRLSVFLCVNIGNNSHFRRCSLFSAHAPLINQIRDFFFFFFFISIFFFSPPLKCLEPLAPSLLSPPPPLASSRSFFSPLLLLLIKFPRLAPVIFQSVLRWIFLLFSPSSVCLTPAPRAVGTWHVAEGLQTRCGMSFARHRLSRTLYK